MILPLYMFFYIYSLKGKKSMGVIKKIELWDQDTLDKYENKKDNFTDNDFDELAKEINF